MSILRPFLTQYWQRREFFNGLLKQTQRPQAGFTQLDTLARIAQIGHGDVQREAVQLVVLLQPANPPADARILSGGPASLAVQRPTGALLQPADVPDLGLDGRRERQLTLDQARQKLRLLHGTDGQGPLQPELINLSADLAIAVTQRGHLSAHELQTDAPRQLLVDRQVGDLDRLAQAHVPLPGLEKAGLAVVREYLVDTADRARGEADQAVANLEGGGRDIAGLRARTVVPEQLPATDLVQHKGALQGGPFEFGGYRRAVPPIEGHDPTAQQQQGQAKHPAHNNSLNKRSLPGP